MLNCDMNGLISFAQRLAGARRMEDFAQIVTQETRRLLDADGVCFVLRDDQQCFYFNEDSISPLWRGLKFPMSACISGWSMLNMRTAVVPDIYKDNRIPHDAYRQTFVRSLVMTPIGNPEPLAAMGVYWSSVGECDDQKTALIETIASIASSALTSIYFYNFLLQAEQKLAIAHETGLLGTFQLNVDTLNLSASPSLKQIFGKQADGTLTYRHFIEAVHHNDRDRLIDAISRTTASGSPFSLDCRIVRDDDSVHALRILARLSQSDHDPEDAILGAVRYVKSITRSVDRPQ